MSCYWESFPHATVTPKLHMLEDHMLEDHVIPFLMKFKVGLGFLGEHGAESIHSRFNKLRRNFVTVPNQTNRLYDILKEHLLQVCPDNLAKTPEIEKRVFKKPRKST